MCDMLNLLLAWLILYLILFFLAKDKKYNNIGMNEVLQWAVVVAIISISLVFVALINYYAEKKKKAAETEKIKLENKITKEITYKQLKAKTKHQNIKDKIQVFQELIGLEEKLKNSGKLTPDEQKKLEALEMLKKEFKTSFSDSEKKLSTTPTKALLVNKKKGSKLPKKKKKSSKRF